MEKSLAFLRVSLKNRRKGYDGKALFTKLPQSILSIK
jgi:hypothetical protein